jgi:hypothetical protein
MRLNASGIPCHHRSGTEEHHRTNRRVRTSGSREARQTRLARRNRQTGELSQREKANSLRTQFTNCAEMTRHQMHTTGWVLDDESHVQEPCPQTVVPLPPWRDGKGKTLSRQWRKCLQRLTRTQTRGNIQPQIGQACLIMKGIAGQDEGQMGIVTSVTRVRVDVTFIPKNGKGTITKSKQPSSLILLANGLTLVQDDFGTVWVSAINGGPISI